MIYLGILTYVNSNNEINIKDHLIESIKSQSRISFKLIIVVNNINNLNFNLDSFKELPNICSIRFIDSNNIGRGRNYIIDEFKLRASDEDKLFLIDDDDQLTRDAVDILDQIVMQDHAVPVINFYVNHMNNWLPALPNDKPEIRGIIIYNQFLFNLKLIKEYNIRYNENDVSLDDLHLYLKLKVRDAKFILIDNCIQFYFCSGNGNGYVKSKEHGIANYLMNDLGYEFKDIIHIGNTPIKDSNGSESNKKLIYELNHCEIGDEYIEMTKDENIDSRD